MKTCVILSGQPRNIDSSFDNIYHSLIVPNDADVFVHSWVNEEQNPEIAQSILEKYKPKKHIFENQKPFINSHMELSRMMNSHGRGYSRSDFVTMVHSSMYSLLQSNLLKEEYRLENNLNYDYVIRARFGITYSRPVLCQSYDSEMLHISNRNLVPNKGPLPAEMVDDRFAFGSNRIMNVYCNGFGLIDHIHNLRNQQDGIFCVETMVYEMVKLFGIRLNILSDLVAH
jgi:hypothetical protein